MQIRLPKVFFDDHVERDLPAPEIVRETARHYIVSATDPALPELLNDALHYADGVDECSIGLVSSARATVRAIAGAA